MYICPMRVLWTMAIGAVMYGSTAAAQDAGAVVAGSAGVTNISSRTELTFTGSAGYRFNRPIYWITSRAR